MPDPVLVGQLPRFARKPIAENADRISVTYAADFSSEQTYTINLALQQAQKLFGIPRTIFIDNGDNPNNLTLTVKGTNFTCDLPAYANGFFPIDAIENDVLSIYSLGGATSRVRITIFNYEIPAAVWYTTEVLTPGFDVQAVTPAADSITNRNNTLVAGVAEDVFPAVARARNIRFQWLGADVLYYRVNADASGTFATDKQAQPGEWVNLPYRTAQRISMYSAAGGDVQAEEWTV